MRIRSIFFAGFVAVSVPGLIGSSWLARQEWVDWTEAQRAVVLTKVVSDVQRAQTAFAVETGQISAAAQVERPDLDAVASFRKATDLLLSSAIQSVAAAGIDARGPADAVAVLAKFRDELPKTVAVPVAQRSPALVQEIVRQRALQGDSLADLAQVAADRISVDQAAATNLVEIATQVMGVRDSLGRRSVLLSSWMSGGTITAKSVGDADRLTGRAYQGWDTARRLVASLDHSPALKAELARQQATFMGQDEARWTEVLETGRKRLSAPEGSALPAWPVPFADFRSWLVGALAAPLVLRDAALDEALAATAAKAHLSSQALLAAGTLVVLTLLLSIASIWLLLVRVVLPLAHMTTAVGKIAGGDLSVEIPGRTRRDEIGEMAGAIAVFKANLIDTREREGRQHQEEAARRIEAERVRREAEERAAADAAALVVGSIGAALERLSNADLTFRIASPLPGPYEKLRADLNSAVDQLRSTVLVLADNGRGIRSGSGEISSAASDLARRTEQQAASLEETAAALDEITSAVRASATGAKQARGVVATARGDAGETGRIVGKAIVAMDAIERSSGEITKIIGVIDEIAFQTSLLALNAGVEAARAGESGRGFAVVASEVRALAQRSAEAAKEIKALIDTSSAEVAAGVALVGEAGEALDRIAAQVATIDGIVCEMAASAEEQATGLAEVNTALNQMDQVTQQNAAMVEETTAACHSLASEADRLDTMIGRFRVEEGGAGRQARPSARSGRTAPRSVGNLALKQAPANDAWDRF